MLSQADTPAQRDAARQWGTGRVGGIEGSPLLSFALPGEKLLLLSPEDIPLAPKLSLSCLQGESILGGRICLL